MGESIMTKMSTDPNNPHAHMLADLTQAQHLLIHLVIHDVGNSTTTRYFSSMALSHSIGGSLEAVSLWTTASSIPRSIPTELWLNRSMNVASKRFKHLATAARHAPIAKRVVEFSACDWDADPSLQDRMRYLVCEERASCKNCRQKSAATVVACRLEQVGCYGFS